MIHNQISYTNSWQEEQTLILMQLFQEDFNQLEQPDIQLVQADLTLVVVGTVADDIRLLNVPKINVCALRFTETARKRILAAGGKVLTFDQLVQQNPTRTGTILLRGPRVWEALKHFGRAAGLPGSYAKPYVSNTAKKGRGSR
ncbi:unnamed protein product (macronuclear) [Paramecium tetraurelia]|uniref:Large ribosomal subunit protein uL15/eL18 domain-containing protein n=1 Tax=Paramecium tetraurelia TaxID=5888 RepID=A0DK51_PARTE|nr:uncharacterized protein GSPATT00017747001 [Paramecium tetraurelia]CAK83418.1 unnamed protein product [Paramecium tetraurelia]|eukprot:XP_001450815.1 hypothetical protein (macronuclear) [Paramecium tetraurelia strain d4-2]